MSFFFLQQALSHLTMIYSKIPFNSEVRIASARKTEKPKIPLVLIKPKHKEANPSLPIWPAIRELKMLKKHRLDPNAIRSCWRARNLAAFPQQIHKEMKPKRSTAVWPADSYFVIHQDKGGDPQKRLRSHHWISGHGSDSQYGWLPCITLKFLSDLPEWAPFLSITKLGHKSC